jgi:hypothetical protein
MTSFVLPVRLCCACGAVELLVADIVADLLFVAVVVTDEEDETDPDVAISLVAYLLFNVVNDADVLVLFNSIFFACLIAQRRLGAIAS